MSDRLRFILFNPLLPHCELVLGCRIILYLALVLFFALSLFLTTSSYKRDGYRFLVILALLGIMPSPYYHPLFLGIFSKWREARYVIFFIFNN